MNAHNILPMSTLAIRRSTIGTILLTVLLLVGLALNFARGIELHEDGSLYSPYYRVRQTLAVALSRLHSPPLYGYLAYGSVIKVFEEGGWPWPQPGPGKSNAEWLAFLTDTARLDALIDHAEHVTVDPSLPPDLIRENELGWVDFFYFAFLVFGTKITSLYYFYFLILTLSCLLYLYEFRASKLLLLGLVTYIAAHLFLVDFAHDYGLETISITNSRLYSALSLPAAAHIFLVFWLRRRPQPLTVAVVLIQSAIVALVITCRVEALWQVLMIASAAILFIGLRFLTRGLAGLKDSFASRNTPLWAPGILIGMVFLAHVHIALTADSRYEVEPQSHLLWHEVLIGLLGSRSQLQPLYLSDSRHSNDDAVAGDAVITDLNRRHDFSSPISQIRNGKITFDLWDGSAYYETMCKSLSLRIVRDHPVLVFKNIFLKIFKQLSDDDLWATVETKHLSPPIIVSACACLVVLISGRIKFRTKDVIQGFLLLFFIVLFSLLTPMIIHPSAFEIASLLSWASIIAIAITCGVSALARLIFTTPGEPSSAAQTGVAGHRERQEIGLSVHFTSERPGKSVLARRILAAAAVVILVTATALHVLLRDTPPSPLSTHDNWLIAAEKISGPVTGNGANLAATRQDFANTNQWPRGGAVIDAGAGTSPDGTNDAYRLGEGATTAIHRIMTILTGVVAGSDYTLSVFVKPTGRSLFELEMGDLPTGRYGFIRYDLAKKVVVDASNGLSAFGLQELPDGWFRCWVAMRYDSDKMSFDFTLLDDEDDDKYPGAPGMGVLIWGVQFEPGDRPLGFSALDASPSK